MSTLQAVRPAFALGIDTGPSTGIGLLDLASGKAWAFQCNADATGWLLRQILRELGGERTAGGIEAFAPGRGPGAAKHGSTVNRQVEELAGICAEYGVPLAPRNAAMVKAWATDKRLQAAGLYSITAKAPDARDACRHALYCAAHDCGWPDPLSRKAVRV